MIKIFISGKITGEPINRCFWKFHHAKTDDVLMKLKFSDDYIRAVCPFDIEGVNFGLKYSKYTHLCNEELKTCTHIYMLKDWRESEGAKKEHQLAKKIGLEIIYQK